jgi:hypothetical protein
VQALRAEPVRAHLARSVNPEAKHARHCAAANAKDRCSIAREYRALLPGCLDRDIRHGGPSDVPTPVATIVGTASATSGSAIRLEHRRQQFFELERDAL